MFFFFQFFWTESAFFVLLTRVQSSVAAAPSSWPLKPTVGSPAVPVTYRTLLRRGRCDYTKTVRCSLAGDFENPCRLSKRVKKNTRESGMRVQGEGGVLGLESPGDGGSVPNGKGGNGGGD